MDVLASCTSYSGGARGVRVSAHRPPELPSAKGWGFMAIIMASACGRSPAELSPAYVEAAVSVAFHQGDDQAATSVRGAVGDRTLPYWSTSLEGLGTPVEKAIWLRRS